MSSSYKKPGFDSNYFEQLHNSLPDLESKTIAIIGITSGIWFIAAEAYKDHIKKVEIITGKSGPIRKEFPFWAESNHQVQYIEPSWHGGSFIIKIQKKF